MYDNDHVTQLVVADWSPSGNFIAGMMETTVNIWHVHDQGLPGSLSNKKTFYCYYM